MTDSAAQDFWLAQLAGATRFNSWVYSRISSHIGGKVLEIGCGSGNFTILMAEDGRQVTGIDLHAPYIETAERRLAGYPLAKVYCGDATQFSGSELYDSIVMLDVLEHIEDDIGFLKKIRASLKPGGRLVLKVPAYRWLYTPMDQAIGHFRRYDRRSMKASLQAAGFELVDQSFFNVFAMFGWWLNGRILKRITPPGEQLALFEKLVPTFRLIEGNGRFPFGISLIAVGAAPVN